MSNNLLSHIEVKRSMMIAAGDTLGLTHAVTLELSKELDKLLQIAQEKKIYV